MTCECLNVTDKNFVNQVVTEKIHKLSSILQIIISRIDDNFCTELMAAHYMLYYDYHWLMMSLLTTFEQHINQKLAIKNVIWLICVLRIMLFEYVQGMQNIDSVTGKNAMLEELNAEYEKQFAFIKAALAILLLCLFLLLYSCSV